MQTMTEDQVTENSAAPMPKIKPPRKGAKPHEIGQRPWQDDPDILNRVLLVGQLTWPADDIPGLTIEKISKMLKIGVGTVHEDRQRFLTLERKAVATGREAAINRLKLVIAEAYRGLQALPASSTFATHRPKYLDIIEKASMSIAKLDGSLDTKPQVNIGIGIMTGPAPNELLAQGKISDSDYEAILRGAALQSQPLLLEGEAYEIPTSPPPPTEGASPAPSTTSFAVESPSRSRRAQAVPDTLPPAVEVLVEGLAAFEEEPEDEEEEE